MRILAICHIMSSGFNLESEEAMDQLKDLTTNAKISMSKWNTILKNLKETDQIELKASTQLPKSFWESCSSFANTAGGCIILGVKENFSGKNEILGLDNSNKVLTDLWNGMSNPNKISFRVIDNEDVTVLKIKEQDVILVFVREADRMHKPIYINGKIENSYIRTGDGDRKIKEEELKAMARNQRLSTDKTPLPYYTLDDLDHASLQRLKSMTAARYPARDLFALTDEEFLIRIGAARKNRKDNTLVLFGGIVLFVGKTNVIRELYPHFHLDYFEFKSDSHHRWDYRISDDDYLNGEINLLTFYEKVQARLAAIVTEPFSLDMDLRRKADAGLTETALREALVNALVHADYLMSDGAIKIEAYPNRFVFSNPGEMLIDHREFFSGGISIPRNELLMSLFRNIGAAERQGYGGIQIYETAVKRDWKTPDLKSSLPRTTLTIWTEGLIDLDPSLSEHDKNLLYFFLKNKDQPGFSFSELLKKTELSEYYLRKSLNSLIEKGYLNKRGAGRSITYEMK